MSTDTNVYTAEQLAEFERQQALIEQQKAETAKIAKLLAQRQAAMDEAIRALEEAKKTDAQRRAEQQAQLEVKRLQEQAAYAAKKKAFDDKTYKAARDYYLQKGRDVAKLDVLSNGLFNWLWERVEKAEIRIAELEAETSKDVPIEKLKKLEDWYNWPSHVMNRRANLLKEVLGDMKVGVFGVPEEDNFLEKFQKAFFTPGAVASRVGSERVEGKVKKAFFEIESRLGLFEKWQNPFVKKSAEN